MPLLTAVTWIAAFLLALAGFRKLVRPAATSAALQGARLPSDLRLVRLLGGGELLLAAAVVLLGGVVATATLALAYAAFAAFAELQRRRGAGCGCLGEASAPATRLHVGLNVVIAVSAAVTAAMRPPSLVDTIVATPMDGALLAVLLAVAAGAVSLMLTALPDVVAAIALHSEDAA